MSTPGRIATGAFTIALLSSCGGGGSDVGGGVAGYAYIVSAMPQSQGAAAPYAIHANGSLSPLSSGPVPTGMNPTSIVADPTGHYVYVVNQGDDTISQFSVSSDGVLTALSPATVSVANPSGSTSYSASIDPGGRYLYVVGRFFYPSGPAVPALVAPGVVLQFSIGSSGALTPLSPASITVPGSTAGPLVIDPAGQHGYLAGLGQVFQFSISGNGTLAPLTQASFATTDAVNVTVTPDGRSAYVLSACIDTACDGQIGEYTVGMDGTLTPTGATTPTDSHVIPVALEIDTSGSGAYLLANQMGVDTNVGALYPFSINSTSGALQPGSPPSVSVSSGAVAESVFGASLYALSASAVGFASGSPQGGHVDHYAIGSGGLLIEKDSVSMSSGYPTAITLVATH